MVVAGHVPPVRDLGVIIELHHGEGIHDAVHTQHRDGLPANVTSTIQSHQWCKVFFFCFAVLFGPAITVLFANDLSQFTDCNTYTALANFNFEQSAVRRYRVIIPFLASGLNAIGGDLFNKLSPSYFVGNFSLPFSFLS